ncbi:DNA cytosine methyltransferase [Saccharopolyspora sp. NPDC000359]|uniref:DNA cytosine methyltransferase n=1 Tax=Saccharopolyspora sp. NPDC000359 TaxID=3154251 RepID=UPI00333276CA
MLTITDLFCGAGGSALGATAVPGVELRIAANHWQLAVESHAANFPRAEHDCADISQIDVRRYPSTDLLWASPECTNHSIAQGRKRFDQPDLFGETLPPEAAERSRATMWDVPRFAEHHHYRAIVVENVVDAAKWSMWPAWLHAMQCLGYRHQLVFLNSMHAPAIAAPRAPQSRDRLYIVFTKEGDPVPDVQPRPMAWCLDCERDVEAVQSWKRPNTPWGRYRAQYLYRCPHQQCRHRVIEPYALPAAAAIDWSLKGQRIGDRKSPLKPATLRRIEAGLRKYSAVPQLVPAGGGWNVSTSPIDRPMRARTTRETEGLLVPSEGGGNGAAPLSWPTTAIQATGRATAIVVPYYRTGTARPTTDPLPTVTTHDRHGLVKHHERTESPGNAPSVDDAEFRMLDVGEVQAAMAFRPSYQVLGTRRERIRQLGNAVTPPAAEFLLTAITRALGHTNGQRAA